MTDTKTCNEKDAFLATDAGEMLLFAVRDEFKDYLSRMELVAEGWIISGGIIGGGATIQQKRWCVDRLIELKVIRKYASGDTRETDVYQSWDLEIRIGDES